MELAAEQGKLENVRADMKSLVEIIGQNRDLRLFLKSPIIKADKKEKVMTELFKDKVSPLTFQFLALLTRKHREGILYDVAQSFDEQYKKSKNILTAVVTSAGGLDKTTRGKMLELVERQSQGEVELVEKVDPSLIGGFILRIGDRQVDRTVARQLAKLKKELINN